MRVAARVDVSEVERAQLERWASSRSAPVRLRERSRIVLKASSGLTNKEIAAQLGLEVNMVGRWRKRYAEEGIAGIERERARGGNQGGRSDAERDALRSRIVDEVDRGDPRKGRPRQGETDGSHYEKGHYTIVLRVLPSSCIERISSMGARNSAANARPVACRAASCRSLTAERSTSGLATASPIARPSVKSSSHSQALPSAMKTRRSATVARSSDATFGPSGAQSTRNLTRLPLSCVFPACVSPARSFGANHSYSSSISHSARGVTTRTPDKHSVGKCFRLPVTKQSALDAIATSMNIPSDGSGSVRL